MNKYSQKNKDTKYKGKNVQMGMHVGNKNVQLLK